MRNPKLVPYETIVRATSPFRGAIRRFFKNAENKRKKTGNLFMISCFGVPFYVAAVSEMYGRCRSTAWHHIHSALQMLQEKMEVFSHEES